MHLSPRSLGISRLVSISLRFYRKADSTCSLQTKMTGVLLTSKQTFRGPNLLKMSGWSLKCLPSAYIFNMPVPRLYLYWMYRLLAKASWHRFFIIIMSLYLSLRLMSGNVFVPFAVSKRTATAIAETQISASYYASHAISSIARKNSHRVAVVTTNDVAGSGMVMIPVCATRATVRIHFVRGRVFQLLVEKRPHRGKSGLLSSLEWNHTVPVDRCGKPR